MMTHDEMIIHELYNDISESSNERPSLSLVSILEPEPSLVLKPEPPLVLKPEHSLVSKPGVIETKESKQLYAFAIDHSDNTLSRSVRNFSRRAMSLDGERVRTSHPHFLFFIEEKPLKLYVF